MKKALVLFSLCLTCLLLVACGKTNTTQNEKLSSKPKIEGFHYYGAIPERPKKIASLSSTYTGYLLKLGYKPVAVTPYDAKNPVLKDKVSQAKVLSSEDQEALVNLKPDLIVIDSSDKNVDKLAKIAPTIAIDYGKQDYLNILTSFGKVFDQEKQAKDWIKNWNEKTAKVGKELKEKLGENATFTVIGLYEKDIDLFGNNWGRGGEVIYQALGFKAPQKVVDDVFKAGYLEVSQEVLPKYIGDYAIVAAEDEKTGASLYESDVWRSIPAVQQGHILKVNANAFYFNDPLSLEYELKTIKNGLKAME